jgi:TonB family protein
MLLLPTFNARLNPCPVSPAAFTTHEQGHFCGQCQRVVKDFTQSLNPVADLAAARAASPDGQVCGTFRRSQVAAHPPLTRRLKWFLLALVLVVGQGLTAQEALAQVRRPVAAPLYHSAIPARSERSVPPPMLRGDTLDLPANPQPTMVYGSVVEQMPSFRGGGSRAIVTYIQQQVVWPKKDGKIVAKEGRLFVTFTVDTDGRVSEAHVAKSLHPLFDEAVLAVVRRMEGFQPGWQNGKPMTVSFTVPITFKLK